MRRNDGAQVPGVRQSVLVIVVVRIDRCWQRDRNQAISSEMFIVHSGLTDAVDDLIEITPDACSSTPYCKHLNFARRPTVSAPARPVPFTCRGLLHVNLSPLSIRSTIRRLHLVTTRQRILVKHYSLVPAPPFLSISLERPQ